MAQISKGDTFTDGQQVTGARLNQLVDSSSLLIGAITDQPNITANTLQSTDSTIVNDGGVLKEATIGDFLNSNLPITTSSILGATGADLVLTPAAGQKVDIAGNIEADDINVTDDLTVGDDATISGDLIVTGSSTLTGNVIADNGFTSNGVANFTGTIQVNGTTAYVLTDIIEETMPNSVGAAANTLHTLFTSASYTKPVGELWLVEVSGNMFVANGAAAHWRITDSTDTISYTASYWNNDEIDTFMFFEKFYLNSANQHTGTFVFRAKALVANVTLNASSAQLSVYPDPSKRMDGKFRILKYKTA
jgi:hypothetical protein